MKFRKKPVVIEAMQIPGPHNAEGFELLNWLSDGECNYSVFPSGTIYIFTLEGEMEAKPGDWIIKGVQGEFYPCKNSVFEATYEKVEDE